MHETQQAIPAKYRKWLYHLTSSKNFESIKDQGLVPQPKSGRFGYMSREAYDGKKKIFLLPILNGAGMKGFLEEWWHGSKDEIVILRMPFDIVKNPMSSIGQ